MSWCEKLHIIQPTSTSQRWLPPYLLVEFWKQNDTARTQEMVSEAAAAPRHCGPVFSPPGPPRMEGLQASELAPHRERARAPLEEMSVMRGQSCSEIPLLEVGAY